MLLGAAAAHNFGLAGAAAKAATETEAAVPGGPSAAGKIAVIVCIAVLFVIAGTNLRRKKRLDKPEKEKMQWKTLLK